MSADCRRVLTNVKTRGGWGEVQLGALLEQVLTADQFARNVKTREETGELVEFAIKLPGDENGAPVWLPIDAKFPIEDYHRLIAAQDKARSRGDRERDEESGNAVEKKRERHLRKYINPPRTTDFALMFLPTEGLYAEAIRRVGLIEQVQRECRVVFAGPTTLAALLNSLQMGFRTLAIQKRSSEVWNLLAAVKKEFGKFGEALLEAVKEKLDQASRQWTEVECARARSRKSCATWKSCRRIRSRSCRSCCRGKKWTMELSWHRRSSASDRSLVFEHDLAQQPDRRHAVIEQFVVEFLRARNSRLPAPCNRRAV